MKCSICEAPTEKVSNDTDEPICSACAAKYTLFACQSCGVRVTVSRNFADVGIQISKDWLASRLCHSYTMRERFGSLSPETQALLLEETGRSGNMFRLVNFIWRNTGLKRLPDAIDMGAFLWEQYRQS